MNKNFLAIVLIASFIAGCNAGVGSDIPLCDTCVNSSLTCAVSTSGGTSNIPFGESATLYIVSSIPASESVTFYPQTVYYDGNYEPWQGFISLSSNTCQLNNSTVCTISITNITQSLDVSGILIIANDPHSTNADCNIPKLN